MASPQRRRLVVTAAVVSAVAFGIGWMLGRGSDAPRHAGAATVTATSPPPGATTMTPPTGSAPTTRPGPWNSKPTPVSSALSSTSATLVGVRLSNEKNTRQKRSVPGSANISSVYPVVTGTG
jgi:hypothetical protein